MGLGDPLFFWSGERELNKCGGGRRRLTSGGGRDELIMTKRRLELEDGVLTEAEQIRDTRDIKQLTHHNSNSMLVIVSPSSDLGHPRIAKHPIYHPLASHL